MAFPLLSLIIFIPIVVAIIILFLDGKDKQIIRVMSLITAFTVLILSFVAYVGYYSEVSKLESDLSTLEEAAEPGLCNGDVQASTRLRGTC
ncbi:MAG UNVERIFIED_CONTAM: hypothetical protein LVT10_08395 [Anaerolineae bacterium]|jgi:NADH:ubiquinone oxidoreductase subunit 4 (subunit M)